MITFKRLSIALTVAALMAGCSSGVKLDDTPVDDKSALTSGAGAGANGGGAGQSGVSGVDLTQSANEQAGPQGVSRIVYFDYDSYVIKSDAQAQVEAHARFLKAAPAARSWSKATPTSAAAANTTWPWAKSVPKPCAAPCVCWACPTHRSKP